MSKLTPATTDLTKPMDILPAEAAPASVQDIEMTNSEDVYELNEEQITDEIFRLFCVLEDLHNIRTFIIRMRDDCASKRTSVVMAPKITAAAFTAVQKTETDLLTALSLENELYMGSYVEFTSLFVTTHLLAEDAASAFRVEGHRGYEVTLVDELPLLPISRVLLKCIQVGNCWPAHILPTRLDYVMGDFSLIDTPEHKKLQDNNTLLCQVLLPFYVRKHNYQQVKLLFNV